MRTCGACEGKGWVPITYQGLREGVECPTCRGLKEVPSTDAERDHLARIRRGEFMRLQQLKRGAPELIERQEQPA